MREVFISQAMILGQDLRGSTSTLPPYNLADWQWSSISIAEQRTNAMFSTRSSNLGAGKVRDQRILCRGFDLLEIVIDLISLWIASSFVLC